MKFKKINIAELARKEGVSYCSVDLLRQSSIELYVKAANQRGWDTKFTKQAILQNVRILLNKMILNEEEVKKWKK